MSFNHGGTHNHGPLAGLGAGTAGVLTAALLILVTARHQLGLLAAVVVWAGIILVCAAALYLIAVGFLRLRLHVRHPETLTGRPLAPAAPAVAEAVGVAPRAAIEPPRVYLNITPGQLEAIMASVTNPQPSRDEHEQGQA